MRFEGIPAIGRKDDHSPARLQNPVRLAHRALVIDTCSNTSCRRRTSKKASGKGNASAGAWLMFGRLRPASATLSGSISTPQTSVLWRGTGAHRAPIHSLHPGSARCRSEHSAGSARSAGSGRSATHNWVPEFDRPLVLCHLPHLNEIVHGPDQNAKSALRRRRQTGFGD